MTNVQESSGGLVNVLTLGIKNDGSEDISAVVNRATKNSGLYFPAGIYKVTHPLFIEHTVIGEGYSRNIHENNARTWFHSAIEDTDGSIGVINASEGAQVNIENLNIRCCSQESGIRIDGCTQQSMVLIDKVGIFNVRGYGVYTHGSGSRPIFLQDMTIFGADDNPRPCVGIYSNTPDNRFTNIEVMGCRIGLELHNGPIYGCNLHLWTGPMNGCIKDPSWWKETRGIVTDNVFFGTNVYPDTCYYALEALNQTAAFHIKNIIYWEDGSTTGSPDFDGGFFHADEAEPGILQIDGGYIAVMERKGINGRMKSVYMAGQMIHDVILRTDVPLALENFDKLCVSDDLPDYPVTYAEKGYCKVADMMCASEKGYTESVLSFDDGAQFDVSMAKRAGQEPVATVTPMNPLCEDRVVKVVKKAEGLYAVYAYHDSEQPMKARFTTRAMGTYFRPLDYRTLRSLWNCPRYRDVLAEID